ncbi:hypothetical protein A2U01_0104804, partial [Trifolium medium]|nr:hypothetical protein [Trifolium medium]
WCNEICLHTTNFVSVGTVLSLSLRVSVRRSAESDASEWFSTV